MTYNKLEKAAFVLSRSATGFCTHQLPALWLQRSPSPISDRSIAVSHLAFTSPTLNNQSLKSLFCRQSSGNVCVPGMTAYVSRYRTMRVSDWSDCQLLTSREGNKWELNNQVTNNNHSHNTGNVWNNPIKTTTAWKIIHFNEWLLKYARKSLISDE